MCARSVCFLIVGFLASWSGFAIAKTPKRTIVRLCPTQGACPQQAGMRWHSQKRVGWWVQVPKAKLLLGQEVHLEVPSAVVVSELAGQPIPKTFCTRKQVTCLSVRVGQMVMFSRLELPKGQRKQEIWLVGAGQGRLTTTARNAFANRYQGFRWHAVLKEGSARVVTVGSIKKASKTLAKSANNKSAQKKGSGAATFLMDLAKTAKSRAKDRVMEQIKKRICKRLCACGKPGKKSILPKTCRGIAKHKLSKLLRETKQLRAWLREDLVAFLQAKVMASFGKGGNQEIVKILLPQLFDIIKIYITKESPYKIRQKLQQSTVALLQTLATRLKGTPQLALLLQLTSAQIQQCMVRKGPCRFNVTRLLEARGQVSARFQALRQQAWKQWQRAATQLDSRYQSASKALLQMPQRCLVAKSAQVALFFPDGARRIANCSNHTTLAFQWKQAKQSMMPNFSAFLKLQPEVNYLQTLLAQNQPFFAQLERLVKKIKGVRQSATLTRTQLRRGLLDQMAGVQWFLTHMHSILLGKGKTNQARVKSFLSLVTEIAQRMLKERKSKASKQLAKMQKKLKNLKLMMGHLVTGQLSRVLELAARGLLESRKKGGKQTAFQYLTMVISYADAARDTSPEGEAKRQKLIEALFDQANDRKNRDQEWLISFGISLGLTTGYQWLAKNQADGYSGEFAPPQLALPSGIAFEYWATPSFGFHFFVFALDLGQLTSYELGSSATEGTSQVNKPTIGSLLALGAHIGLVWGSPASPFVLGIEARYSPTLFESKDNSRTGSARIGLFLGTHFHFFDFL